MSYKIYLIEFTVPCW